MTSDKQTRRRCRELKKAQALAECSEPGASVFTTDARSDQHVFPGCLRPTLSVKALDYVRVYYGISLLRACQLVQLSRSKRYYDVARICGRSCDYAWESWPRCCGFMSAAAFIVRRRPIVPDTEFNGPAESARRPSCLSCGLMSRSAAFQDAPGVLELGLEHGRRAVRV